jgi:hypothetical protein
VWSHNLCILLNRRSSRRKPHRGGAPPGSPPAGGPPAGADVEAGAAGGAAGAAAAGATLRAPLLGGDKAAGDKASGGGGGSGGGGWGDAEDGKADAIRSSADHPPLPWLAVTAFVVGYSYLISMTIPFFSVLGEFSVGMGVALRAARAGRAAGCTYLISMTIPFFSLLGEGARVEPGRRLCSRRSPARGGGARRRQRPAGAEGRPTDGPTAHGRPASLRLTSPPSQSASCHPPPTCSVPTRELIARQAASCSSACLNRLAAGAAAPRLAGLNPHMTRRSSLPQTARPSRPGCPAGSRCACCRPSAWAPGSAPPRAARFPSRCC